MTVRGSAVLLIGGLLAVQAAAPVPSLRAQIRRSPDRQAPRWIPPDLLPDPVLPDTSAALGRYVAEHLEEFVTPEFTARKTMRREFQRRGYANMLHDLLALDPVSALLSFLRTRLQIEYSLPHNTIYFRDDTGTLRALPEDRTFPADPWKD